jgi:NADPH:quinone reductase-like Zn-dependent oxidoreductase
MEAVQLDSYGGAVTVRQCAVPKPGRGQVLVRMAAAPINPSDLSFLRGTYKDQKPLPAIPGIEGSGRVVAAGPGLFPRMMVVRRVACASSPTSGGTWAEYMVTSAKLCIPLLSSISLEAGAMMAVNPLTALAFFDIAESEKHAAMVSTAAASALGRMILRLGQLNSIPIISVVRRKEQVDLLQTLGAEYVLDSSQPDFGLQLRELTHELRATLLLDAVAGSMTNQLLEAAPAASTVLVYGNLSGEQCIINPRELLLEGKRVEGFYLANWWAKKNIVQSLLVIGKAQRLLRTHLGTRVQQRLPLSSAREAVALYENNMSGGKVLLVANGEEIRRLGD